MRVASSVALLVWIGSALHVPVSAQGAPESQQGRGKTRAPVTLSIVRIEPAEPDRTRLILRDDRDNRLSFIEAAAIAIRATSVSTVIATEGPTSWRAAGAEPTAPGGPLRMILHRDGPLEAIIPGDPGASRNR